MSSSTATVRKLVDTVDPRATKRVCTAVPSSSSFVPGRAAVFTGGHAAAVSSASTTTVDGVPRTAPLVAIDGTRATSAAAAAGVWHGKGRTLTAPSTTLFVTNIAPNVPVASVAALFENEPGFIAFRTVRRMSFVDFRTLAEANAVMRRHQNHIFVLDGSPVDRPLLIDYDKDDRSKRDKQFDRQIVRNVIAHETCEYVDLMCPRCSSVTVQLRIVPPATFDTLPRRAVDQSLVVDTRKHLIQHNLQRGAERFIRRERGVEPQFVVACSACACEVGYTSVRFEDTVKHLFLRDRTLATERCSVVDGKRSAPVYCAPSQVLPELLSRASKSEGERETESQSNAGASSTSSSVATAAAATASVASRAGE